MPKDAARSSDAPQSISLAGRDVAFRVRRSARARHLRLRVSRRDGLEIVAPLDADLGDLTGLLAAKQSWILSSLDRLAQSPPPPSSSLTTGAVLRYLGRPYTLEIRAANGQSPRAELRGGSLILTIPESTTDQVKGYLEDWYRLRARRLIPEQVAEINQAFGFTYHRITIKGQRSRWGSCSTNGNLNFNWHLMMAPLSVIRYVITHELAHLGEMNHSDRFWALVASRCPDYQAQRTWLKRHGASLGF